jgi:hypothetical protein
MGMATERNAINTCDFSPEGLAGESGELGVGGEQHQVFQFRLGGQHPIKGIAVGLSVCAGPQAMGRVIAKLRNSSACSGFLDISYGACQLGQAART